MVDTVSLLAGVLLGIFLLVLIGVIVWVALWGLREFRRRQAYERAGVSHLDLYFDEHFPNVVRNFDLVPSARFDSWANGMTARLATLSHDIDLVGKARRGLDSRMDRLEKRLGEVE